MFRVYKNVKKFSFARLFSSLNMYYDSQSGKMLPVPGSMKNRYHDVSLLMNDSLNVDSKVKIVASSNLISSVSVKLDDATNNNLRSNVKVPVFVQLESLEQFNKFLSLKTEGCEGIILPVDLKNMQSFEVAKEIFLKLKENHQIRVRLSNIYEKPSLTESTALYFLDRQVRSVILVEGEYAIDSFDFKNLIESLLGYDVEGESVRDRLGVRASIENLSVALNLGISQFETVLEQFIASSHKVSTAETISKIQKNNL